PTALPISIHLISDWQAFRPADEDRRRAAWRSGEFDPCESAKQLLEEDSHFKPRQMLTEASMDSLTKDCTTCCVATQEEAVRLVESLFVAIGREVTQHQPATLRYSPPAPLHSRGRGPHDMVNRRCPSLLLLGPP